MKQAREELAGWVWVGVGGLSMGVLPIWLLLAAVIIQLSPDLAGFRDIMEHGIDTDDSPSLLFAWVRGGVGAGVFLAVFAPLTLGVGGVAWLASGSHSWWQRRERKFRDEGVQSDVRMRDVELKVSAVSSFDPRAEGEGAVRPASRGRRAAAFLTDLLAVWMLLPGLPLLVLWLIPSSTVGLPLGVGSLLVLSLLIAQGVWLGRTGQTLGKRLFGVRVVRQNGDPAGFRHAVLIRALGFGLLIVGVPVIGWFVVPVVDVLMLLGDDGRALHDLLADTVVVDATSG